MDRVYIKNLKNYVGKKVSISGWVDVRRDHGKLIFIDLRDGGGVIQAVSSSENEKAHAVIGKLRSEWVLKCTGTVNNRPPKMVNPEIEFGDIEFSIMEAEILGEAKELPFEKDAELNFDTHLDYLPLTLRNQRSRAIFKVQGTIIHAFRNFLTSEGFTEIQAPKIIGEDAEGGTSVFDVDYFSHTAHLAQSPQFYKQIMVGVFEKVFATGNVFRAEKHNTTRHLNEYTSLDIEMGFIEDHSDIMKIGTKIIRAITLFLEETCAKEFNLLEASIPRVPEEIPSLKLREAQRIIADEYGEDATGEPDLSPQHERWIYEYAVKKFDSEFIYITHFPIEKRPMYTYEDENDPGYTKSFDLIFRGLEINTGGQRIHDYEKLIASMKRKGLKPDQFLFYLQAFKFGMPPHGGFGMGLERLTARMLGLSNVKEAALFPREINRIDTLLSE